MSKTKKQSRTNKQSKTKKQSRTKYIPLNLSVKEFRNRKYDFNTTKQSLINFLNNKPSKVKLNKLYDTTFYFAESDSIGEGYSYVKDFTRQEFDVLCKMIKTSVVLKGISEGWKELYIYISYELLHHLRVL